jgi:hypothetical protein
MRDRYPDHDKRGRRGLQPAHAPLSGSGTTTPPKFGVQGPCPPCPWLGGLGFGLVSGMGPATATGHCASKRAMRPFNATRPFWGTAVAIVRPDAVRRTPPGPAARPALSRRASSSPSGGDPAPQHRPPEGARRRRRMVHVAAGGYWHAAAGIVSLRARSRPRTGTRHPVVARFLLPSSLQPPRRVEAAFAIALAAVRALRAYAHACTKASTHIIRQPHTHRRSRTRRHSQAHMWTKSSARGVGQSASAAPAADWRQCRSVMGAATLSAGDAHSKRERPASVNGMHARVL